MTIAELVQTCRLEYIHTGGGCDGYALPLGEIRETPQGEEDAWSVYILVTNEANVPREGEHVQIGVSDWRYQTSDADGNPDPEIPVLCFSTPDGASQYIPALASAVRQGADAVRELTARFLASGAAHEIADDCFLTAEARHVQSINASGGCSECGASWEIHDLNKEGECRFCGVDTTVTDQDGHCTNGRCPEMSLHDLERHSSNEIPADTTCGICREVLAEIERASRCQCQHGRSFGGSAIDCPNAPSDLSGFCEGCFSLDDTGTEIPGDRCAHGSKHALYGQKPTEKQLENALVAGFLSGLYGGLLAEMPDFKTRPVTQGERRAYRAGRAFGCTARTEQLAGRSY